MLAFILPQKSNEEALKVEELPWKLGSQRGEAKSEILMSNTFTSCFLVFVIEYSISRASLSFPISLRNSAKRLAE